MDCGLANLKFYLLSLTPPLKGIDRSATLSSGKLENKQVEYYSSRYISTMTVNSSLRGRPIQLDPSVEEKNWLRDRPIEPDSFAISDLKAHHRIPEIFLIGSAKSATSLLAKSLDQHPKIKLGSLKEPNFFSHYSSFSRGFDWYSSLYDNVRSDQFALDASTGYTRWPQNPGTAGRIHACAPNAKLVYLMRHPVERAYSHFVHRWTKELYRGMPFSLSFEEHVEHDPMCLDSSNYQAQIEEYLQYFPRESLLCLFTKDVEADKVAVLQKICRFIGVDDSAEHFKEAPARANQSSKFLESRVRTQVTSKIKSIPLVEPLLPLIPKSVRDGLYEFFRGTSLGSQAEQEFTPPPIPADVRQQMLERFADSNAWVAEFAGRDLSHWNQ